MKKITFFACPKPFRGEASIHQTNAINSWMTIPDSDVMLLGNEEGVGDFANTIHARHIPKISYNQHGTPLLNSIFTKAIENASSELLCFINSDIILFPDFSNAAEAVSSDSKRFLMVGRRLTLEIEKNFVFSIDWTTSLKKESKKRPMDSYTAIDYFLYPKGFLCIDKPFAVGRAAYDNWILWSVRQKGGAKLIDATHDVLAIHQKHGYKHVVTGINNSWEGEESEENRRLAGGYSCMCNILDSTHILRDGKIIRANTPKHIYRRAYQILRKIKRKFA